MTTTNTLFHGDCRDILATLPDNSVDSIVADPPYELGFMGKSWDNTGVAYDVRVWMECLRVLKPGGHLLAFGGSRTYHRLACAIEDAGFQIRDQIMWVYGSGFPKSLDVSKAIDKQAGAEREVIGNRYAQKGVAISEDSGAVGGGAFGEARIGDVTAPATDAARQWEGWGTALKPAHEPIVLARKPFDGTVANNVLTYGTGALNIDESRVPSTDTMTSEGHFRKGNIVGDKRTTDAAGMFGDGAWVAGTDLSKGRWPANVIHDGSDEVTALFPDTGKSQGGRIGKKSMSNVTNVPAGVYEAGDAGYGDSGSAARFFYSAKASKADRNDGLHGMPNGATPYESHRANYQNTKGIETPYAGTGRSGNNLQNFHPTVKPTDLMRYLCRLVTPPNGTILDPFTGSGSTGKAAILEGFNFIGIDQSAEYLEIAQARILHAQNNQPDPTLF